jgi:Spy/CpxP family protein refolding chaperone
MKHGAVRKLTKAATLSLLVLTTTAGMASWEVLAASPAMAQASDPGSGSGGQGNGSDPGSASPAQPSNPVTGVVGGLLGGGGTPAP